MDTRKKNHLMNCLSAVEISLLPRSSPRVVVDTTFHYDWTIASSAVNYPAPSGRELPAPPTSPQQDKSHAG